jgi:hypothetical protein
MYNYKGGQGDPDTSRCHEAIGFEEVMRHAPAPVKVVPCPMLKMVFFLLGHGLQKVQLNDSL